MALYHLTVKAISRSKGKSAVSSAAYRSGEKLYDEYNNISYDFTRKTGIKYTGILLPVNAPVTFFNRETLWNAAEKAETRINSRTAREIEAALPGEFILTEQIKLVSEYIRDNFISQGMCADFAVHDKDDGNPHSHIMLTTREVNEKGFTVKNRDWDKRENVIVWRREWAYISNSYLERNGFSERIDHRTLIEQGIKREPTIHLGHTVKQLERKGIITSRNKKNREIIERNKERGRQNRIYEREFDRIHEMEMER
jgi:uncharacterized membrane protein